MMNYVAVIGTGIMAAGIAAGFIAQSIPVVILGRTKEKADACLDKAIALACKIGLVGENAQKELAAIKLEQSISPLEEWSNWDQCIWVIETVAENLELKQQVFAYLDQVVPAHIPIGSNSSGFPISKISAGLKTAHRMFNAHYFMPAHIVPLVEVVLGEKSDPVMGEQVCQLYRQAKKKPVLVRKDIPGFLANRIQHALMREALSLVQDGIATPDDIDTAVRYSFGFRYAAVGPMTQKEISGWEGMAGASVEIWPSLYTNPNLQPCVAHMIEQGKYGMKSKEGFRKWSDTEMAQMRHKYNVRLKAAFDVLQVEPDEN